MMKFTVAAGIALLTAVAGLLATLALLRRLVLPVQRLTATVTNIADGDLDVDLPDRDRSDEIGGMARAVEVLRTSMVKAKSATAERDAERVAAVRRQEAMDRCTQDFGQSVAGVMSSLAEAAGQMRDAASATPDAAHQTRDNAAITADGAAAASHDLGFCRLGVRPDGGQHRRDHAAGRERDRGGAANNGAGDGHGQQSYRARSRSRPHR